MRNILKKYSPLFIIPVLLVAIWTFAQSRKSSGENEKVVAAIVSDILNNVHYSSSRIDDNTSAKCFENYLERLDYNKQFFLKEDIEHFEVYKTRLDDQILNGDLSFYDMVVDRLYERIAEVEALYPKLLEGDLEVNGKIKIETDPEKRDFFKNEEARIVYWKEYLSLLTMNRLANKIQKQEKDKELAAKKGEDFSEKSKAELMEAAKEQVRKNLETRFKRRKEIDEEDQFAIFINSLSSAFGPHSEYFPPQQKENFDMRMTGRLEGIGAQLTQENEYIKVVSIVAGSASWKQGDLKANDLILKVAQGEEEPVDIVGATMKEAISLIRGPKGTEVRLTVQKPNGEVVEIPIIRDVVIQEETYAKSALFKNKKSRNKIGYIYLPTFYSTFGQRAGRRSADDIRNELIRLKKEGVDGVILDLRNNGGGSLGDAIDMAGHFFTKGPVVQVKPENRMPRVYSDRNPEVAYDGPVIVMINGFSASASEILAGALKDHHRAIIVGTPSFGKGTVQTMIDMNEKIPAGMTPSKPLGSYKVTIQQFYRTNGASTQLKGVRPHIFLPDEYGYMETGIKSYDNPLPWDSVDAAPESSTPKMDFDINQLRKQSKSRVNDNPIFVKLEERNAIFRREREESIVVIDVDEELDERKFIKLRNEEFNKMIEPVDYIKITSLQEFLPEEEEEVVKEKRENWEKQLAEDYHLLETINIMEDMLK